MVDENPFARLFNKSAPSVQLAVLEAGSRDMPIQVRITNVDPEATSYDCISYDRSQDYGTVDITVDNQPLSIAKPLEAALRSLRFAGWTRTVWADLLIGSSTEERSTQAAVMKNVVENADSTIVWLGPADEHSAAAFDIMQTMANRWHQARLHSGFPEVMSRATVEQMTDAFQYLLSKPVDDLQPSNQALWQTIEKTIDSSYFRSVHAIPDIVLAKKITVASGTSSMNWTDFKAASRAAPLIMAQQINMTLSPDFQKCFELIYSIEIAERRKRAGESIELLPMIQSSGDCNVNDPRDIVYSMLPIVTPSLRTQIAEPLPIVDYTKSTAEVFTEAARYIVHERQDLLLWWTARSPRGRKVRDLPSWVPDWSVPLPKRAVKVMPTMTNGMRVWWEHIVPKAKRITVDDSNALHVQAHALDRVVSVSPIFTDANCRRLCLTEWQALPSQPGEDLEARVQKMFRTLLLNQAGFGDTLRDIAQPKKEMWVSFQSVLAEERVMELLGCTEEQMMAQPELAQRARELPEAAILGPQTGRSQEFEALLRQNAIGRRFFRTESGKTGMTAVESLPDGAGPAEGEPQVPNFDAAMAEPMGSNMLSGFQKFLQQRDPRAAGILAQALSGSLPGQAAPGVRAGDLVVALVGGFQPYVLRPATEYDVTQTVEQSLQSDSKYSYVGDCYLHGVMDGEPFKTKGWFSTSWTTDVKLVDITIT
ncbi:hypothetical protein LTR08_005896 [Meristemomyces frigidus]|nr:hypothetical protein LTR08_005896 [Meristemomyces frigidus]